MRVFRHGPVLLGGLFALAACGPAFDPLTREGLWHPARSDAGNLTLMVADPIDLAHGTGRSTADGQLAAAAVDRLRADKVKKLPASDIATFAAGSSGDNNGSSGSSGSP